MNSSNIKRAASKMYINNPYHHDFVFQEANYFTAKKLFLTSFDLIRILFYMFVVVKVGMKAPQYLMFRRKNYLNHPDYMLINEAEYEQIRDAESVAKI